MKNKIILSVVCILAIFSVFVLYASAGKHFVENSAKLEPTTTLTTSEKTEATIPSDGTMAITQTTAAKTQIDTPAQTVITTTKKQTTAPTTKKPTAAPQEKTTCLPKTTVKKTQQNPAITTKKTTPGSFESQVIDLVNVERAKAGLNPLTENTNLSYVATLKSEDMAKLNYFDHTSPTYGSPFDMMKQFGVSYRAAGENIAMGQTSPEQVMNGWMNSEGHRKNILSPNFTQIGVGIARNAEGRLYWTQQFIG